MIRPEFSLISYDGKPVTLSSFRGRSLLVYFGFTNCRVVCPRALGKLSQVIRQVRLKGGEITPLFITVDPERDTAESLRDYLQNNYPEFLGLTGDREQIDRVKVNFKVFSALRQDDDEQDGYSIAHTALSYLISSEGEFLDHYWDHLSEDIIQERILAKLS